jgi:hypothetical protein
MTGIPDDPWVVRLRVHRSNAWPSPPMTRSAAVALAERIRTAVLDVGDGAGFIEFDAVGGRVINARARSVESIEVERWRVRTEEPGRTTGFLVGQVAAGVVAVGDSAGPEATDYLRRQAAAERQAVRQ